VPGPREAPSHLLRWARREVRFEPAVDALPQHTETAVSPRAASSPARSRGVLGAALRTWLRYAVPLTVLSAIALSPVLLVALAARAPADAAGVAALRPLGWKLVALAVFCQLVLIGGASPAARARPTQLRALGRGLAELAGAIVPCIAAVAAVALGGLALVVPGLLLLALLALTGASTERGVRARLADSVTIARKHLPSVALAVLALLAIDAAIGIAGHRLLAMPLPRHPSAAQLATARRVIQAIALALVVVSPLPATLLAAIRSRAS